MRKYIELNKRWLFSAEEVNGEKPFSDSLVSLPFLHKIDTMPECTFSAKWIPGEEDDGKTLYLKINQLTAFADIYLGDKFITSHTPSDSSFTVLLTLEAHMNEAVDVIIKIRPTARPDGYFVFAGAHLITADSSHFEMSGSGKGIIISTDLSETKADIKIQTNVIRPNNYDVVSYSVSDMKNTLIFSKTCKPTSPDVQFSIDAPELWEGQSGAYLYKLKVSLLRDSQCLDEIETYFGIREFELKSDGFLYLNGFRLPLNGVELSDCSSVKNDIVNLKKVDANTLVSSFIPTKTDIIGVCDIEGLFFWYALPYSGDKTCDMSALKEFLLSYRNNPSLAGVVCSEEADSEYFTEFCKICNNITPSVIPVLKRNIETAVNEIPENARAIMLTLPFKEDSEAFMGINVRFTELTEKYPDVFFAVSPAKTAKDVVTAKQFSDHHIRMWNTFCRQKGVFAYFAGLLSDGKAPDLRRGLTSADRMSLYDIFWFYKAQFSSEGFIKICESEISDTDAKLTDIKCITNCENLRILVNGKDKKYKAEKLSDGIYVFRELKLKKGVNTIEVSAADECDYTEIER